MLEKFKERRRKWIEALRGGEYKQARLQLCKVRDGSIVGYCCLGVACEVYQKEVGDLNVKEEYGFRFYNDDDLVMPAKVSEWLGLYGAKGEYDLDGERDEYTSLANMNDNGKTFAEIADFIESTPSGLFLEDTIKSGV